MQYSNENSRHTPAVLPGTGHTPPARKPHPDFIPTPTPPKNPATLIVMGLLHAKEPEER